jgi:membrane glycosyltransferase
MCKSRRGSTPSADIYRSLRKRREDNKDEPGSADAYTRKWRCGGSRQRVVRGVLREDSLMTGGAQEFAAGSG